MGRRRLQISVFVCRLPEVVLHWAAGLLTECGKERHGVDLFGRDSWLLGQLLLTLVSFATCLKAPSSLIWEACCSSDSEHPMPHFVPFSFLVNRYRGTFLGDMAGEVPERMQIVMSKADQLMLYIRCSCWRSLPCSLSNSPYDGPSGPLKPGDQDVTASPRPQHMLHCSIWLFSTAFLALAVCMTRSVCQLATIFQALTCFLLPAFMVEGCLEAAHV